MGLFGTLFGKRGDKSSSENVSPNQLNPREKIIQEKSMVIFDRFTVHPDLIDLIWILDGPRKNFENQPCNIAFEIDGISVYLLLAVFFKLKPSDKITANSERNTGIFSLKTCPVADSWFSLRIDITSFTKESIKTWSLLATPR